MATSSSVNSSSSGASNTLPIPIVSVSSSRILPIILSSGMSPHDVSNGDPLALVLQFTGPNSLLSKYPDLHFGMEVHHSTRGKKRHAADVNFSRKRRSGWFHPASQNNTHANMSQFSGVGNSITEWPVTANLGNDLNTQFIQINPWDYFRLPNNTWQGFPVIQASDVDPDVYSRWMGRKGRNRNHMAILLSVRFFTFAKDPQNPKKFIRSAPSHALTIQPFRQLSDTSDNDGNGTGWYYTDWKINI